MATQRTHDHNVTVGVWGDAGSRYEKTPGESRLVERSFWSNPKCQAVEDMGGFLDAKVGREVGNVAITCSNEKFKDALGTVKEILYNSAKDPQAWAQMHAQAEQEIDTRPVSTEELVYDRTYMNVFRDYGLGNTHFPNDYSGITHAGCNSFIEENFSGQKMVVTAIGKVEHDTVVKEATALFGNVPKGAPYVVPEKPYFVGCKLDYRNDEMGHLAYFTIAWPSCSWRSADAAVFMVIAEILGSWRRFEIRSTMPGTLSGCRLTNAIANKSEGIGCCDFYEARQNFHKDTGILTVYCVADECALNHAREEIQFAVNMLSGSVQEEEVERAKRCLKLKLFNARDTTAGRANQLSEQLIGLGRFLSPQELAVRIDAIDAEDVKRVAFHYLHDSELSVSALGPTHGLPEHCIIRMQNCMRRY